MDSEQSKRDIERNLYEIYSQFGHEYASPGKFKIRIILNKKISEIQFKLFRNMRNGVPEFTNELIRGTATMPGPNSLQLQKSILQKALLNELQQNKIQMHIFPPELIQDILDLHFLEQKNAAFKN